MKFCSKCGAQLDDNDVFCVTCGTQQSAPAQTPAENVAPELTYTQAPNVDPNAYANVQPQAPYMDPNMYAGMQPEAPKKSKKGLIIGLIAGLVVIAAVVVTLILVLGGSDSKLDTKKDKKEIKKLIKNFCEVSSKLDISGYKKCFYPDFLKSRTVSKMKETKELFEMKETKELLEKYGAEISVNFDVDDIQIVSNSDALSEFEELLEDTFDETAKLEAIAYVTGQGKIEIAGESQNKDGATIAVKIKGKWYLADIEKDEKDDYIDLFEEYED